VWNSELGEFEIAPKVESEVAGQVAAIHAQNGAQVERSAALLEIRGKQTL